MKEMLDGKGGILINPLKPKEIAKAIIWLLENPQARIAMGNHNRQKIELNAGKAEVLAESYYQKIILKNRITVP